MTEMAEENEKLSDLSAAERMLALQMLMERRAIAKRFALLASLPTGGFILLRLLDASTASRASRPAIYGILIAVVIVVGLLIWYFGYRLVGLMQKDIDAGKKLQKQGKLEAIETHGNAYGEMITYVTLGAKRYKTRGKFFDRCRGGEQIEMTILPLSRVLLSGRVIE